MTTSMFAKAMQSLGKALLAMSLLSVLVSWRASAVLFMTGSAGYLVLWLLRAGAPQWPVGDEEPVRAIASLD